MDEYISKGAMLKNLTADLEHHSGEGDPRTHFIMRRFIKYVKDFPAADVQPIRCGRWIDIYEWAKMHDSKPSGVCTYYWCSECENAQKKKSKYCPECGARMDLKGGDAE